VIRLNRRVVGWRTSLVERHFLFVDCAGKETDGRISPRRFREAPRATGSCGGARRLQCRSGRSSKLGRAGAVDRDHEEHGFYSWIGISGVREVRLQLYATEVARVRSATFRQLRERVGHRR
jgi:hypothetical protein